MIQAIFERIAKHDLTDWAVLLQGLCGVPSLLGRLPTSCVENFANAELEKVAGNNPLLEVIVSLASDSDLPLSELCPQLKKMSEFQNTDMRRAKRIWRAVALEELLANLDSDPLYGLIKLSEFWSGWDWSADAPLSMIPGTMTLPQHQYHSASDQYGRQVKRTDYTNHGYGNQEKPAEYHSDPHTHTYEYGPGYGSNGKETRINND